MIRYGIMLTAIQLSRCVQYRLNPGVFKIPVLDRWVVVVCRPDLIMDVKLAPENLLSFHDAAFDVRSFDVIYTMFSPSYQILEGRYTLGSSVFKDPYHFNIIQGPLTRNIGKRYSAMFKEAVFALAQEIPIVHDGALRSSIHILLTLGQPDACIV